MGFKTWILQHCKISIYFSGVWLICGSQRSSCFWLDAKDVVFFNVKVRLVGDPFLTFFSVSRRTNQDLATFKLVSYSDLKIEGAFQCCRRFT